MCCCEPAPELAIAMPGFCFAAAINSLTLFTPV
jgi:hypothetical protein